MGSEPLQAKRCQREVVFQLLPVALDQLEIRRKAGACQRAADQHGRIRRSAAACLSLTS